jgi:uncharacterized RDD family membrane protein YckC
VRAPIDTDVAIETPEHIVFRHRVAGPARRLAAHVVDLILCYGALFAVALVVGLLTVGASLAGEAQSVLASGAGVVLLLLFVAQWVYFVAFEALRGTTPGKRALGLSVVTTSGRPIGFVAAALRNVLRAADLLPGFYAVGVVSMTLSRRFQRLGDLVAGTMVIIPDHARVAAPLLLWPTARPEELRGLPETVALDAEERAAIELFLRRRGTLGTAREQELAQMIVEPLAARFGYRVPDASRTLALLYDRAANAGRAEAPPSSGFDRPALRAAPPSRGGAP